MKAPASAISAVWRTARHVQTHHTARRNPTSVAAGTAETAGSAGPVWCLDVRELSTAISRTARGRSGPVSVSSLAAVSHDATDRFYLAGSVVDCTLSDLQLSCPVRRRSAWTWRWIVINAVSDGRGHGADFVSGKNQRKRQLRCVSSGSCLRRAARRADAHNYKLSYRGTSISRAATRPRANLMRFSRRLCSQKT